MSEQSSDAPLDSPESQSSVWQFPPDYLVQRVVTATILQQLRWGLHIASCRLISRGWRATIDAALPLLVCRPHVPQYVIVDLAGRFGAGLHILWLRRPGLHSTWQAHEEVAAVLAHIASDCQNLVSLQLLDWNAVDDTALKPLASLSQLTSLQLSAYSMKLCDKSVEWLPPRLHSLDLSCQFVEVAACSNCSGLQQLRLGTGMKQTIHTTVPGWMAALAQLTRLRSLGLTICGQDVPCHLRMLSSLAALTHLGLAWTSDRSTDDWGPALTELLAALAPAQQVVEHPAALVAPPAADERFAAGTPAGTAERGLRSLCLTHSHCEISAKPGPRFAELALQGLQALTWRYARVVMDQPNEITRLAALTSLDFSFDSLWQKVPHNTMAAMIARRLTNLQQLSLLDIEEVSETDFEELSCLQQLTALSLTHGLSRGGRALAVLQPLTRLRKLTLKRTLLSDAGLAVALDRAAALAGLAEGGALGPGYEQITLLPGLTYLSLTLCQQLSTDGLVQMAAHLPSLRHLVHRNLPWMERSHVQQVLDLCPQLELFQTAWTPRFRDHPSQHPPESLSASEQAAKEEEEAFLDKYYLRLQHSNRRVFGPHYGDGCFDYDAVGALVASGDTL